MVMFFRKKMLIFILLISFHTINFAQKDGYFRAHLWEKEIAAFSDSDKKEFPKKKKILFVGSSSIRG